MSVIKADKPMDDLIKLFHLEDVRHIRSIKLDFTVNDAVRVNIEKFLTDEEFEVIKVMFKND